MHPFRPNLLEGRSIALSGIVGAPVGGLVRELGASVHGIDPALLVEEEALSAWARAAAPLDALVCSEGGAEADSWLLGTWAAVRAVAAEVFIPRGQGRIVLIAPGGGGGPVAAALENLARTLSVEWARFGITAVSIVPGNSLADADLATLVGFLCSPAGGYYSGARFELS